MRAKLLDAILGVDMTLLDETTQITIQRTLQIVLNRFGRPDDSTVQKLITKVDPLFPSESADINWLCVKPWLTCSRPPSPLKQWH